MKRYLKAAAVALVSAATLCIAGPAVSHAENPIVQTSFTPDPAPVVFGDELWVYTGCDRDGQNGNYIMTGWQAFSTKDMKNWTDHGKFSTITAFRGAVRTMRGHHSVSSEMASITSISQQLPTAER